MQVVEGMRFVYENYTKDCWYWEIVEICRKIVLTSGLALIGPEGRTYLGLSAMASGMYAVGHAHSRPMPDYFEHMLQVKSQAARAYISRKTNEKENGYAIIKSRLAMRIHSFLESLGDYHWCKMELACVKFTVYLRVLCSLAGNFEAI